ncbi:methyltransferase domain protein [Rhizoctonia solani AG-3 Rhs1AP]|uniref:Methyltransferase domain protein n=2 Tax=Rhizoctonia solani AG-3 TaxID=1086053 RepID=A0A074S8D5_9AGAM|nr:methyltransferase domain protein [Rhizoctonia solani AG-3 Rhs1AP]KEP53173.1 methyltransferase domain protein [Rhizoctonia solani 123E]
MDSRDNTPIYLINDSQDDSDIGSVYTTTSSGLTEHTMSTLTSDAASEYFQEVYGRMFPVDENIPFLFPADDAELRRLKLQHLSLKLVFGSNYFGPARSVLLEVPSGRRKHVLDLFTADGTWVREMAAEFPHVDFTSVDIVPLVPHPRRANILGYEVYDVYNGIAEVNDTFDLIHLRYSMSKIRKLPSLIRELHRVLRPGGLFLYGEYENEVFDDSTDDHNASGTAPYLVHASRLSREAFDRQGVHAYAFKDVPRLLDSGCALWSSEMQRKGFIDIIRDEKIIPAGQWPQAAHLREAGLITQYVWCEMWKSLRPLFINHGMSSAEANELINGAITELMNHGPRRLYAKYHVLYAFKPM